MDFLRQFYLIFEERCGHRDEQNQLKMTKKTHKARLINLNIKFQNSFCVFPGRRRWARRICGAGRESSGRCSGCRVRP